MYQRMKYKIKKKVKTLRRRHKGKSLHIWKGRDFIEHNKSMKRKRTKRITKFKFIQIRNVFSLVITIKKSTR